MIPVQRLHDFPQPLMTVVLLVPHVLVIAHFARFIQRQRNQGVYFLWDGCRLRGVFLLKFEYDLVRLGGYNLGLDGARLGHNLWNSCLTSVMDVWR
jgi:hypothetical protein